VKRSQNLYSCESSWYNRAWYNLHLVALLLLLFFISFWKSGVCPIWYSSMSLTYICVYSRHGADSSSIYVYTCVRPCVSNTFRVYTITRKILERSAPIFWWALSGLLASTSLYWVLWLSGSVVLWVLWALMFNSHCCMGTLLLNVGNLNSRPIAIATGRTLVLISVWCLVVHLQTEASTRDGCSIYEYVDIWRRSSPSDMTPPLMLR